MRGSATTIAVLLSVLVVAACGSGDDGSSKPEDVVKAYHVAIAEGDAKGACAELAPTAQQQLRESTQGAARGSCEKVIELLSAFWDGAAKKALREAKVTITEDGDAATASFRAPLGIGGPAQDQSYDLRRSDGDWKIERLQLTGN